MACRSLKDKKEPGHKSNVRVRTADALKNSFNGGQLKRESHTIGRSKDIFTKVQCRSVSNYSYGIFFIVFGLWVRCNWRESVRSDPHTFSRIHVSVRSDPHTFSRIRISVRSDPHTFSRIRISVRSDPHTFSRIRISVRSDPHTFSRIRIRVRSDPHTFSRFRIRDPTLLLKNNYDIIERKKQFCRVSIL